MTNGHYDSSKEQCDVIHVSPLSALLICCSHGATAAAVEQRMNKYSRNFEYFFYKT